jgi:preprotein translocase subunit SecF
LKERTIPFLKYSGWAYAFSLSLFVVFIVVSILKGGLHLGVDFVGGLKIIAKFQDGVDEHSIRTTLKKYNPTVQQIGEAHDNNFIISTKLTEDSSFLIKDRIIEDLEEKYKHVTIDNDDVSFLSFSNPVDEGAIKQKLAGFDAEVQKIGDAQKYDYIVYKKESTDKKKLNYNANSIETALKAGFTNLDIQTGVAVVALFTNPVDEAAIKGLVKKYNVIVIKSRHALKQGLIMYKISFDEAERIKADLVKKYQKVDVLSVENVGPAVGSYLRKSAVKLILMAIVLMTIYLAYRFEVRYAVGAMVALLHDITLATAFCGVAGVEINIPVIAALLTIFGYSVNDTIIIFDRIREDTNIDTKTSFIDVMDRAITETLSRTTITVILTLYSVIALWLIGGEGISDFALVLIFGFVIGCYSSIYQAAPVVLWWERFTKKVRAR